MSDGDWDSPSPFQREGGRGRGRNRGNFFSRSNDNNREDTWNGNDGFGDSEREGGSGRGRSGRGGSRGRGGSGGFGDRNGDNEQLGDEQNPVSDKPRPTYIPPETEDDSSGIEAGMNFAKYDNIEVKVSGENVPKRIESFQSSGLREILIENLSKCNYTTPTPIQKYAIPILINKRDMMASAQTGSGKTAAFVLPILHALLSEPTNLVYERDYCEPQCVIMSPTRELAIQIRDVVRNLAMGSSIKFGILYGGTATRHQINQISMSGVHILVATPGRLKDFVQRGVVSFKSVRFFVLDEADRMLDMGFKPDIEEILGNETMVNSDSRQTLLFSATLPDSIQRMAKAFMKPDYIFVAVGIVGGACKDVVQEFKEVTKFEKKKELINVLKSLESTKGTMVFVEQKRNADFIAAFLSEHDYPTTSIHGDREQPEREQALRDFKSNKMDILVATAVAARGLDIKGVNCVINFDMPSSVDEYVHRIGRTGRLGNSGKAVSFFDRSSDGALTSELVTILKQADQEVPSWLGDDGAYMDNGESLNCDIRHHSNTAVIAEEEEGGW